MREKALIWKDETTELWREVTDEGVTIYRLITTAAAAAATSDEVRRINGEISVKKVVTLTIS